MRTHPCEQQPLPPQQRGCAARLGACVITHRHVRFRKACSGFSLTHAAFADGFKFRDQDVQAGMVVRRKWL